MLIRRDRRPETTGDTGSREPLPTKRNGNGIRVVTTLFRRTGSDRASARVVRCAYHSGAQRQANTPLTRVVNARPSRSR